MSRSRMPLRLRPVCFSLAWPVVPAADGLFAADGLLPCLIGAEIISRSSIVAWLVCRISSTAAGVADCCLTAAADAAGSAAGGAAAARDVSGWGGACAAGGLPGGGAASRTGASAGAGGGALAGAASRLCTGTAGAGGGDCGCGAAGGACGPGPAAGFAPAGVSGFASLRRIKPIIAPMMLIIAMMTVTSSDQPASR